MEEGAQVNLLAQFFDEGNARLAERAIEVASRDEFQDTASLSGSSGSEMNRVEDMVAEIDVMHDIITDDEEHTRFDITS